MAFKLSHALIKSGRERGNSAALKMDLRDYLDIAALGNAADMVPLHGENRSMVSHGLAALEMKKWEGRGALNNAAGLRGEGDQKQRHE